MKRTAIILALLALSSCEVAPRDTRMISIGFGQREYRTGPLDQYSGMDAVEFRGRIPIPNKENLFGEAFVSTVLPDEAGGSEVEAFEIGTGLGWVGGDIGKVRPYAGAGLLWQDIESVPAPPVPGAGDSGGGSIGGYGSIGLETGIFSGILGLELRQTWGSSAGSGDINTDNTQLGLRWGYAW